jgi:hypothetical protein
VAGTDGLEVSGDNHLRSGWTRFETTNPSTADHAIELAELHPGVNVAQFRIALESPDGLQALPLAEFIGGVDDIPHHTTFTMTVNLTAGHFVIFDSAQGPNGPDGPAWFTIPGFVRDFTVNALPTLAAPPEKTATLTMRDFTYRLPPTLPSHGIVEVRNLGHQLHQAAMLRLDAGATLDDVIAAIDNNEPPPGQPLEFVGILSPGRTMYFHYDLAPATYVIADYLPDFDRGGIPHAAEGMITSFTVVDR